MFPQHFLNYVGNFYIPNVSTVVATEVSKDNFKGKVLTGVWSTHGRLGNCRMNASLTMPMYPFSDSGDEKLHINQGDTWPVRTADFSLVTGQLCVLTCHVKCSVLSLKNIFKVMYFPLSWEDIVEYNSHQGRCKNTSYIESHLYYQLSSVPCLQLFPEPRALFPSLACFQNVSRPKICEAVMQSNPLTHVNLYALSSAARLGDRLGWVFFQAVLYGYSFAPWLLWQDAASSWLPSEVCTEVQIEKGTVLGNAV